VEQELPTLPEHLSSPPVFSGVRVTRSLVLCVVFCRSLFVLLYFFLWPLCCLSFFDLRNLITPLVSSNFSYLISLLLLISADSYFLVLNTSTNPAPLLLIRLIWNRNFVTFISYNVHVIWNME